jgi:tetratricopeptide (TPR) repeat protein
MRSAKTSPNRLFCCSFLATPAFLVISALRFSPALLAQDNSGVVDIVPPAQQQTAPSPATQTSTAQPKAATAPAQSATASAAADKSLHTKPGDFTKEALVFDKLYSRIREEADGTGTRQTTARVRILADAGVKAMAVLTFTYTASDQQMDIAYVRVIKPDGTVVVTPAYNVQDLPADVTRAAPMYSDIHQKHVAVKGMGVGDVLEYQAMLTTTKPEVPGHFWFDYSFEKNLIILDEQVDLDIPADKQVTVASAHDDPQPTITNAAGRKLYHWASSNLARPDPDAPPKSTKNLKPSIQVSTFATWQQVGEWYQGLQRDSLAISPAVQAKATALTKGLTSDDDKIRAIFNDVALHIHYVGLEFGIGRYQPHLADDVLSNEYGDCKDKHTLLATELKAIGIDAWPVLISADRELDPDTPSPAQFNHVITVVPNGGRLLWMDSTEEVAPMGNLMATLRDKQALVVPNGKAPHLERTPTELPYVQKARFESEGKLSEQGVYTGRISQSYHGDVEFFLRTVFRQVPQSQWKEALQRFSSGMGFSGDVSNPHISEIEQTSQPFEISYDYTREKFGEWDDHRIFPSMPSTGWALYPGVKEKKPADPVEVQAPGEQDYISKITLPKGWSLDPQGNVDLKEDWAEYHATYSLKDGVYFAERKLLLKKNKVPLEDWDKYLAFRRAIYADEVKTTWLVGANGPSGGGSGFTASFQPYVLGGSRLSSELREEIMNVLEPASSAEEILEPVAPPSAADLAKASILARQAVDELEEKSATLSASDLNSIYWMQGLSNAWSALGWSAYKSKDLATAENYLRAAWRLSQDRQSGFRLGQTLEAKGEKQAAAHQYELAVITAFSPAFGEPPVMGNESGQMVMDAYKQLTGHELKATSLKNGQYNGSLREELDKMIEVHPAIPTTKLNGTAFFVFAFALGNPTHVTLVGGDKALSSLTPALQAHPFPGVLPTGSKAVLLREARVICSQWSGCDVDFLLPTAVTTPPISIFPENRGKPVVMEVAPPEKK